MIPGWVKRTPVWSGARLLAGAARVRRGLRSLEPADPGRPAVLVANHFFDGEIAALRASAEFRSGYQIIELPYRTFFTSNWSFFPPPIWRGDEPYDAPEFSAGRERSARHARRLLERLRERYDVAALVSPSDSFFWVRGLYAEARAAGMATFVFDKEGVVSPATFDNQPRLIASRYPPLAERFYVWNERQVAYWEKAGLDPARTKVLGSLRTDLFVNMPAATSNGVLFFDFDTGAYLEDLNDPELMRDGWSELKRELHTVLVDAIERHPDVPFTIKCHPQQTDLEQTKLRFEHAGANVRVMTGSVDVHRIVEAHSLIAGFQTTALLETALTTRPALYCGWGPLHDRVGEHLLPLMQRGFGIINCTDPLSVREAIEDHLAGRSLPRDPDRARIEAYFHRPDGHTAARYARALTADLEARVQR